MSWLENFVKDWGGFEKFIADLNSTGEVTVEHDVTLTGQSGAPRQIDVLITHQVGLYQHKILVECRYWKQKIKRTHVDAMAFAVKDLGASKGVFFTTKGYQSGAKTVAEKNNIDLFLVREPTDAEWGSPGRKICLYLQVCARTIFNLELLNPSSTTVTDPGKIGPGGVGINLVIGDRPNWSKTPTVQADGSAGKSLEEIIDDATMAGMQSFLEKSFLINGGEECTRYFQQGVNVSPEKPIIVLVPGARIEVPGFRFDLGIKIAQSQINVDRMDAHAYAVIVEDCVRRLSFVAAKRKVSDVSTVKPQLPPPAADKEDVLKNNSVIRVITKHWFNTSELADLVTVNKTV